MWFWEVRLGRSLGTASKTTLEPGQDPHRLDDNLSFARELTARTRVYVVSITSRKNCVSFCISGWSTH